MSDDEFQLQWGVDDYSNTTRRKRQRNQRLGTSSSSDDSFLNSASARRQRANRYIDSSDSDSSNSDIIAPRKKKRSGYSQLTSSSDSDSNSTDTNSNIRKSKVNENKVIVSETSESDSEIVPRTHTRNKSHVITDDMNSSSNSSSSSSSNLGMVSSRRLPPRVVSDDEDEQQPEEAVQDSSPSDSPISTRAPRVLRLLSSNESSDSSSESDFSGEFNENVPESDKSKKKQVETRADVDDLSSSDYDDQTECCPICFRKLRMQEIGTPEACDHSFCVTCLTEWAKNVNTCPVDRQRFSLILVRRNLGGKIIEQIPVEDVQPDNNVPEVDQIFCEVCGRPDREDRMILCDGCDLGYHMDCLVPQLTSVPIDDWYCPLCEGPFNRIERSSESDYEEIVHEITSRTRRIRHTNRITHRLRPLRVTHPSESDNGEWETSVRSQSSVRQTRHIIPRTRQNQRIIALINATTNFNDEDFSSEVDHQEETGTDGSDEETINISTTTKTKRTAPQKRTRQKRTRRTTQTRRKTKRKRNNCRFKIKLITTEEGVIEVKLPRKKKRKRQRKRRSRRQYDRGTQRVSSQKTTVKVRLAKRLGIMCNNRQGVVTGQNESNINVPATSSHASSFREAIPTLDLFGNRNTLDDFSGCSEDEEFPTIGESSRSGGSGGGQLLTRHGHVTPFTSGLRVMARKKAVSIVSRQKSAQSKTSKRKVAASSSTSVAAPGGSLMNSSNSCTSLLDSILDSQTKWHSKNSEIIHNHIDGSLTVKVNDKKVDVNKDNTGKATETPLFPGGSNSASNNRFSGYNYQSSDRNISGRPAEAHLSSSAPFASSSLSSFPTTRAGFSSNYGMGISPFTGAAPIRFRMNVPVRRSNITTPAVPPLRQPPFPDPQLFAQDPSPSSSPNEDEEVDIYSDIEPERTDNDCADDVAGDRSFGTLEPPPEPPALLMGMGQDDIDEENDEGGLVIDDRPCPPQTQLPPPPPPPTEVYDPCEPSEDSNSSDGYQNEKDHPNYGMYPTTGPLMVTKLDQKSNGSSDDADDDDSAECPNFSMYSAASMNLARKNDEMRLKTLSVDDSEEISNDTSLNSIDDGSKEKAKDDEGVDSVKNKVEGKNKSLKNIDDVLVNDSESDVNVEDKEEGETKTDEENTMDIPIPEELKEENIPIPEDINNEDIPIPDKTPECEKSLGKEEEEEDDEEDDDDDKDDEDDEAEDDEEEEDDPDKEETKDSESSNNAEAKIEVGEHNKSKSISIKVVGTNKEKDNEEQEGEDECSTQDVLDLAIGSEGNLQDNANDENEEAGISIHVENPEDFDEGLEKAGDASDKPDGLVDITDEEMSVYDGPDNLDNNLDKFSDKENHESNADVSEHQKEMFDSEDENSLIGGATSAVSTGPLNTENQQVSTLPGLEGLETETISESEDVNFDELPEGNQNEERNAGQKEEEFSTIKRKKKKRTRKATSVSENDEVSGKAQVENLEFEEGEIIEDKPKQSSKKEKKSKGKHDKEINNEKEDANATVNTAITSAPQTIKEPTVGADKKQKKKKDRKDGLKDKNVSGASGNKSKEPKIKEKTAKVGDLDENVSWKKPSKSTKERNYRDGKEKTDREENKKQEPLKEKKKTKEKRKELERYDVRRLISEKPKRPKKDEFGRDLSPSKSRSLTPPRYRNRSPLRVRNRSRSRSWRSRSRSKGRQRRSRSRGRFRSRSRERGRSRSRDRTRRSRSRNRRSRSRDRRRSKSKDKPVQKTKKRNRTLSRTRRRTRSRSPLRSNNHHSRSFSPSWSPSWSRSSVSRSRSFSPRTGRTRSFSRSLSRSWSQGHEERGGSLVDVSHKNARKNLTVIVTNKEAVRKKDKKKGARKKDADKRKRRQRGQSPVPSKEVFTSGDNILVSVNFKSNRGGAEVVPATTPVLRESSKRKRDEIDPITGKRKKDKSSKENVPLRSKKGMNKSNRLNKLNEAMKNAKPVAIIDLDMSPFREQTPSPKEVIILSDEENNEEKEKQKQQKEMEKQLERLGEGLGSGRLTMDSNHLQSANGSQPESPSTHNFMMTSTGPKTPPEPHVKFSIVSNKPQLRVLTNPLMECDEELRRDEATETDMDEVVHKGPNTPPEPPPELNTPASPPTTPYDPFDPTKSRSPSPQPPSDAGMQVNMNSSREDKSIESSLNLTGEIDDTHAHVPRLIERRTLTPTGDSDELKKTPEPLKSLAAPKVDTPGVEISPKHQSPASANVEPSKISDDSLLKPFQKLLSSASKIDSSIHKSPDKLMSVGNISQQQIKTLNQAPLKSGMIKKPALPVYTPTLIMNSNKSIRAQQNGGTNDASDDVLDIDAGSPYSPGSSEGDDLFDPPPMTPPRQAKPLPLSAAKMPLPKTATQNKFDMLFSSPVKAGAGRHGKHHLGKGKKATVKGKAKGGTGRKEVGVKLDEDQLKILDDLPSSAVEMQFLKKLNRQERVVEEVKLVLKPHYAKKHISKEDYKEILRRSVPKICHNKSGEINPMKIQFLIEAYVRKFRKVGAAKKKPAPAAAVPSANQNMPPKPKIQKTMWS